MMKPSIYRLSSFDRGAKATWLMTEMGVDFKEITLNREKKENETPEYLKMNPMGRVPVLVNGDDVLFESGAICTYLADTYSDKNMAPAVGTQDRAEYLKWMFFAASTLDVFQVRIMVIEDIPPGDVYDKKFSALASDLTDAMTTLNRTLERNDYLVANKFSTADICVSYHLYWLTLWPELNEVMAKFPKVMSYLERMKKVPSAIKADVFTYGN